MKTIHQSGLDSEGVVSRCSSKYVLLKIWQICEIFKKTFLYKTPPVAASLDNHQDYVCFIFSVL